jgi:chromate transport protein ChrA
MGAVGIIIIAALLAESVWETGKMVWQQGKVSVDRVGALVVGLVFAMGAGLDLCALLGIGFIYPIIGQVLTGILLSRGANFVHDLFKSVEGLTTSD